MAEDRHAGPLKLQEITQRLFHRWRGPTVITIDGRWHFSFDENRDHKYGVIRSEDLTNWEDISNQLVMPPGIRHGTVLRVPRAVVEGLQ